MGAKKKKTLQPATGSSQARPRPLLISPLLPHPRPIDEFEKDLGTCHRQITSPSAPMFNLMGRRRYLRTAITSVYSLISHKHKDDVPSIDDIHKFLDAFIGYQEYLNKLKIKLDELKKKLLSELKEQGIEL